MRVRIALYGVVLCFCFAAIVSAQDATKVDPKHYTVVSENDQVRIVKIHYGPHEKSVMHSHPASVVVPLDDAKGTFTYADGKKEDFDLKAGGAQYSAATTHLPENTGDAGFDAILVELKGIQAPPGERLLFKVHAKGNQVYTCKSDTAQFTWTLKAPDAKLFDKHGKPFGKHFAGPSWKANDGSRVTGTPVANVLVDADSIPWLLIKIISHDGNGVLSPATSIQRLNTQGGKAPASGCDASHIGQEVRVPYSADYLFYAPK